MSCCSCFLRAKPPLESSLMPAFYSRLIRSILGLEWTDEQVAEAFEVSRSTVIRIRERFVEHGLDDALNHRHAPRARSRVLDGEQEAHLIALPAQSAVGLRFQHEGLSRLIQEILHMDGRNWPRVSRSC
jgi:hypothetical protein